MNININFMMVLLIVVNKMDVMLLNKVVMIKEVLFIMNFNF